MKTQETRHDEEGRKEWKLYLARWLYERGYGREDVINLFWFIDWMMSLPEEVEEEIWQEIREYEEVEQMAYITSVERIGFKRGVQEGNLLGRQEGRRLGREEGVQQGIQQGVQQGIREGLLAGIELGLELKFGSAGLFLLPEIYKIEDVDVLRAIHEGLKVVTTVEELRPIYQPA